MSIWTNGKGTQEKAKQCRQEMKIEIKKNLGEISDYKLSQKMQQKQDVIQKESSERF